MKLKIFLTTFVVAVVAVFIYSQTKQKAFASAEDFPRQAVLYLQIADLPAFLKLWNESKFKETYLESDNFYDFKNNHLGRKLASRWQEFNEAAGFEINLDVLSGLAENQAAIAVYDVGKLDFVFISPVSDEIFAAMKFAANRDKFTEEKLDDVTTIYSVTVKADRGRQKQELIFAQLKNRFIVTTSKTLLLQTLDNINETRAKNRLIDEPSFTALSEKIEPHLATVWLNQAALNDDYYFKRYWLMSDVKNLKNMRAGIFDFEVQDGRIIEKRKFLLDKTVEISPINNADAAKMLTFLPSDIPFYRMQSANPNSVDDAIEKMIFARQKVVEKEKRNYFSGYSSINDYDYYSSDNYEHLSEDFDESIDEKTEVEATERREIEVNFSKILRTANPKEILTFTSPKVLSAPMFVKFQRAAIFYLASPQSLNRNSFESAIAQKFAAQTMIDAPGVKLNWETKFENGFSWRELNLPKIGWNVSYAFHGNILILANDADFLQRISSVQQPPKIEKQNSPFTALTFINIEERENAFNKVFTELDRKKMANNFFTGNIASLLDSMRDVRSVEIKENYDRNLFDEEITLNFK